MKYLKLFENFDDNKGYELISSSVYYDTENIESIIINDKIFDIINNRKTEKVKSMNPIICDFSAVVSIQKKPLSAIKIETTDCEIAIEEVEDYYYFVGIDDEIFYKCDQDEGLLELLKELGIIYE
jgi:hypothetical protein